MPTPLRVNKYRFIVKININFRSLFVILLSLLLFWVTIESLSIWKDLSVAASVFSPEHKLRRFSVTRNTGSEQVVFNFSPDTPFFMYTGRDGIQRIGYYWKYLPILEKEFKVPFVGSRFDEVPKKLSIEYTPSVSSSLKKLNNLPKYPLSIYDKFALSIELALDEIF